jgi:hypothetical protein
MAAGSRPLAESSSRSPRTARESKIKNVTLCLLERFAELLCDLVVVVFGQRVASTDDQGDWPVDDLQGGQSREGSVIGELVGSGYSHAPDDGQINGETLRVANPFDGAAVGHSAM